MNTKSFILTSAGLKNIIQKEDEFTFIFGERSIKTSNVFAQFLSPIVSHLHHSDPTIESIHFDYPFESKLHNLSNLDDLISEDIISILQEISKGSPISLNNTQSNKLQILSIFLDNDELFNKLEELFPKDKKEENIDNFLNQLQIIEYLSKTSKYSHDFDITNIIDNLASHFESIKIENLKKISKNNLFKIISNKNLQIESYESLFDIILEIFNENEDKSDIIYFYEILDFDQISDEKLKEVMMSINPNHLTMNLWEKICERIFNKKSNEIKSNQSVIEEQFLYDGNKSHCFEGIINHLTKKCGGNVHDKGVVITKASSENNYFNIAKCVVDFENKKENEESRLLTRNDTGSWIQFDFKNRRVHPTHYTIRSINWDRNRVHPQSWIIEGSNTGENDWKTIDSQNNVDYLNGNGISHTFEINTSNNQNEYYRFLRLKQTGLNKRNDNYLSISALEYFGKMKIITQ